MNTNQPLPIVLASSSRYRKDLLLPMFPDLQVDSPGTDEIPGNNEAPEALAMRLASEKAAAVAGRWPNSIVIGCDQVAALDHGQQINENTMEQGSTKAGYQNIQILGKPGNFDKAFQQLSACQGKAVSFYSACCVINTRTSARQVFFDHYRVAFRQLSEMQIQRYLQREQPYDCAGSIKSEGLGASLIRAHEGKDPATLIGLPLIDLLDALDKEGIRPL